MSPAPRAEYVARLDKLLAALAARGIVSDAELTAAAARTDRASPAIGAAMVARAWSDPEYRALLLRDGRAAAEAMGASMAGAPPLGVLEDTPDRHHLVVCTLCSCYPRAVLGYPPGWFKSFSYRSRAVRDPRGLLAEFGTVLPAGMAVRVVDSTADYRWMVLPRRPADTEGWDPARLAALVDAQVLIGATLPNAAVAALA
jgi:nitrile hydratase subunit alpha